MLHRAVTGIWDCRYSTSPASSAQVSMIPDGEDEEEDMKTREGLECDCVEIAEAVACFS